MLPQVPIIRVTDSEKIPMPSYSDGIGTCVTLRSNEMKSIKIAPRHYEVFSTGFAIALPMGMEAQIRSLKDSTKTGIIVLNAPATIDASDRKEIKVCIYNASQESVIIKQGDPIAIMVFSLALRVQWVNLAQKGKEQKESPAQSENQQFTPLKEYTIQTNNSKATESQQDGNNPQSDIKPIERPEDVAKETEDVVAPEESSPDEEPITPPDILEEFEKIESEFENKQTEGSN